MALGRGLRFQFPYFLDFATLFHKRQLVGGYTKINVKTTRKVQPTQNKRIIYFSQNPVL
jgi:hypothetical protein